MNHSKKIIHFHKWKEVKRKKMTDTLKLLLTLPFNFLLCLVYPSYYKKELDLMDVHLISGVGDFYD